jgi:hypothetical protein
VKCWLRDALWTLSDRLCALGIKADPQAPPVTIAPRKGIYRVTFALGHWIGEAGWLLR